MIIIFARVSVTLTGVALLPEITCFKLSVITNTVLAVTRSTFFLDAVTGDPPHVCITRTKT